MPTGTPPASEPSSAGTAFAFLRPLPSVRADAAGVAETRPVAADRDRWDRLFPSSSGIQDAGSSLNVAGLRLGPYLIQDRIGRGGMGAVFRASDLRLDRIVALKILAPEYTRDPACVQRFQNEARAAAKLDHENIARIFSSGEDNGQQYIAFEYVSGTNVRDMILQRGMLTSAETVNYVLQMAESLRHTSAMGVVHRDIKPSNIIITLSGRAKLVDLGLARHRTEGEDDLTVHGTTLGTFDYISPEQALDPRNVDVRSDLYSLGCTAYHMLTGEPPYTRGSMFQKVLDHHKIEVPDASSKNPLVPQALSHIVRKMMASQVDDRYQRPEDLIRDLLPLASSLGVPTRTGLWSEVPAPRFPWAEHRGWVLALSLLALIGVIASLPPQETNPLPESIAPPANSLANSQPQAGESPSAPSDPSRSETRPASELNEVPDLTPSVETKPASPLQGGVLAGTRFGEGTFATIRPRQFPTPSLPAGQPPSLSPAPLDKSTPPSTRETGNPFWAITAGAEGASSTQKSYATLEAACLDAPSNSTIELRFDGDSPAQIPIRVEGKSLRIRAMPGCRPVLRFEVPGPIGQPVTSQMISVINGELEIFDIDIMFRVPPKRSVDRWSVFSLEYAKKLTLHGVSVTLENAARQQPGTLFEIKSPSDTLLERMMPESMKRGPAQVLITDSLVRGEADGFRLTEANDTRIEISNSAWAISGTMLAIDTSNSRLMATSVEPPPCQMKLDHITAVLDGSLVSVTTGEAGVAPTVRIRCDNSLVSLLRPDRAMISMVGPVDLDDWLDRLQWQGSSNFMDVGGPWWEITAVRSSGTPNRKFNAADWGRHWNSSGDTSIDRKVFESNEFREKPVFYRIPPKAFHLSDSNMADKVPEAADGTRAGVDWNRPRVPHQPPQLEATTGK